MKQLRCLKSVLPMLTGLLVLGGIALPGWAESQRYPTDREMQLLTAQFRRNLPKLQRERSYVDRRTPTEKQQVRQFAESWATVDAATAPFLGGWSAIEESMYVYPSRTKGRVCILETYIGDRGTGIDFSIGMVASGRVRTNTKQFLVKQGNFLAVAFVYQGKPGIYEYANPRPLQDPATVSYLKNQTSVLEQFNRAGCTADLPARSDLLPEIVQPR